MLRRILSAVAGCAALAGFSSAALSDHGDTTTVAYFLEWPTANQVAQHERTYDTALGQPVTWRAFANGNEMTRAMVAGDVQIAYSQGFVPFVVGVTAGAPLKLVGIAVTYAENDLCILHEDSGITAENARALEGKRIASPVGNATHYKLLRTLAHLGVDASRIELAPMDPTDAAQALIRGDVVMACAFGGALDRMREVGYPLLTGAEQEAAGIETFDIVAVTEEFASAHPGLVRAFLRVTEEANAAFLADPAAHMETIAHASDMDRESAAAMIANFGFPSVAAQKGERWLGSGVQAAAKNVAETMAAAGLMDRVLDDYSHAVDAGFLE